MFQQKSVNIGKTLQSILLRNITYLITQHIFRFNDQQRDIATILLGMSNPMGIVMGQLFTPLIVQNESDVPLMNIIW